MNENPIHPDDEELAYLRRRSRKNLRARIVTYIFLSLFALVIIKLCWVIAEPLFPNPKLTKLTNLPYPDLSAEYQSRLLFEDHLWSTHISTEWLTTNKYLDDRNMYAGLVRVRFADFLFDTSRKEPAESIILYITTQHPARLILDPNGNTPLTVISHETMTIPRNTSQSSSATHQTDSLNFEIPTDTFIAAINHGSITLKLAGHTINFTDDQFLALKDFAATLKPGFEPPISSP